MSKLQVCDMLVDYCTYTCTSNNGRKDSQLAVLYSMRMRSAEHPACYELLTVLCSLWWKFLPHLRFLGEDPPRPPWGSRGREPTFSTAILPERFTDTLFINSPTTSCARAWGYHTLSAVTKHDYGEASENQTRTGVGWYCLDTLRGFLFLPARWHHQACSPVSSSPLTSTLIIITKLLEASVSCVISHVWA